MVPDIIGLCRRLILGGLNDIFMATMGLSGVLRDSILFSVRRISGILENASPKGNIHWRAYWNSCAYNYLAGRTRVKLRWPWFGVRALPLICTVHVNDIGPFAKDAKGKPQHPLRPDPDVVVDLTPHAFDILTSDKKPRRSVCHSHRP